MIAKIKKYAQSVFNDLKNRISLIDKSNLDIIKFIVGYIIFVFSLFIVGWGYLWYIKGIPDLLLLLKGIDSLSAPAMLAVIKFVTGACVDVSKTFIDKNNNGIDDRKERKKNEFKMV